MRIWYLPYEELDNPRVLAQHQELHALGELFKKRVYHFQKTEDYLPSHLKLHWDFLQEDLGAILFQYNHDVVTLGEMKARGFPSGLSVHNTPFDWVYKIRDWDENKEKKVLTGEEIDLTSYFQGEHFYDFKINKYANILPIHLSWTEMLMHFGLEEVRILQDVWDLQMRLSIEFDRDINSNTPATLRSAESKRKTLEKLLDKYGELRNNERPKSN